MRPSKSSPWSHTLDKMEREAPGNTFSADQAFKTLHDLFRRTAAADAAEKSNPGIQTRRCARPVADAPKGRCALALLNTERDRCTFHANPTRFAATGITEDEVYGGSPLMRDQLAP